MPCYLCGSNEGPVLVDDPPFQVRLCAKCGLGYTTPRVRADRLQEIYDLGYFTSESAGDFGYAQYADDAPGYLKTFERKVAHRPASSFPTAAASSRSAAPRASS